MTEINLGRFTLRNLNPWDGPRVFKLTSDPVVMKYMGFPVHKTLADTMALLETYQKSPSRFQAVCVGDDLLGIVGVEINRHQAAMTIMFRRDWKARGAGREVAMPFVQWIFTHPQIWRVWAYCHVDNVPIQRVLERMNAVREGRLRRFEFFPNISTEEPQDVYAYSIVRS